MHKPNTRQMFTILLPNMLPSATPTASSVAVLKMATVSSGSEVEREMRKKPTAVFPKPVISATLSLFVMVMWLNLSSSNNEASRRAVLSTSPLIIGWCSLLSMGLGCLIYFFLFRRGVLFGVALECDECIGAGVTPEGFCVVW